MSELYYFCPTNGNYYSEYDIDDDEAEWKENTVLWECEETQLPKFDLYEAIYNHVIDYVEIEDHLPRMKCLEDIEKQIDEYISLNFRYNKENKNKRVIRIGCEWAKDE